MPSPKLLPRSSANPSPSGLISLSSNSSSTQPLPQQPQQPQHQPSTSTSSASANATALHLNSATADIEMETLRGGGAASGHRRRRSSLLSTGSYNRDNSGGSSSSSRSGPGGARAAGGVRPRGQSLRNAGRPDDIIRTPRIPEDEADDVWGGGMPSNGRKHSYDDDGDSDEYDYDDDNTLFDADDLRDDEETGLTRHERRRKARARQLRTRFDQRFVRGRNGAGLEDGSGGPADAAASAGLSAAALTTDERKEADKNVLRRLLINGSLILLWYLFSLSISVYNKWMFGEDSEKLNFPFPLFTTSVHMLVQFTLSAVVLYFVPSLRPSAGKRPPPIDGGSNNNGGAEEDDDEYKSESTTDTDRKGAKMTKWFYLTRIGPCGAATGLDIGLGNMSLKFISLTFYTMCKSSSLAFVLLFAFFFRLETPTWRLVGIIATMTAGVIMMVAGQVEFKVGGFLLVMSAAFFSGFRWGLTQIMLLRNPATSNPFSSIFYLAPVMFVTLFAIALPTEGFGALLEGLHRLFDDYGPLKTPVLIIFPGTIAFLMTASEFALLQRTSVVTLSIAGIFKEVVTIATASLVFGDTLTLVNLLGLIVTLTAITAYNYIKITRMRQQAQVDVHLGHQSRRPSEEPGTAEDSAPMTMGQYAPGGPVRTEPSGEFAIASESDSSPAETSPVTAVGPHATNDAEVGADTEDAGLLHKGGNANGR